MRYMFVVLASVISGCAAVPVAGNETQVLVRVPALSSSQQAIDTADTHCGKYGRVSQYAGPVGYKHLFYCVPKQ